MSIYRKCGDLVAECDGCGEECEELFIAYSNKDTWLCEDCLKEDFDEAFENWKVENFVDLEAEEEKQDDFYRGMAEDERGLD